MVAPKIRTIDACAGAIAAVGAADAKLARIQAELNETIAAAKKRAEAAAGPLVVERDQLVAGIQAYCDKKRDELLGAKGKTVEFATGKVGWRKGRPSLEVDPKREGAIIQWFWNDKTTKHLVRQKLTLDRQAILKQPDAIVGVRGLKILPAEEDFWVEPVAVPLAEGPAARAAAQ